MGQDVEKLQELIDQHDRIVFFGGAGVSTESGIPDFRSVDGLYNQKYEYPPETILSHTFFMRQTEEFYLKWMRDLADSQDTESGHIPHTAPFAGGGGGPGLWGGAMVFLPWKLYREFGNHNVFFEYYNSDRTGLQSGERRRFCVRFVRV